MQKAKVTVKDIAAKTGLSVSAVSFALSGKGRINAKTRELVIREAEKMGYQPNIFASTLPMKNKLRIGVICPENDIYFCTVLKGIEAYYTEISHYKVELVYFFSRGYDPQDQLKKLQECQEAKMDGILLTPLTNKSIINMVRHITNNGTVVVTYTNDLSGSGRLCFVGQDGKLAGRLAADLMDRILMHGAKISLLESDTPLIITQQRVESFTDYMRKSDKQYVLANPRKFPNELDAAINTVEKLIVEETPDAVYANNMLGTLAVGRVLYKLAPKRKIVVFGYDANKEIDEMLCNGIIDLTLYQDPFYQGYYALMLLFRNLYYKQKIKKHIYHTRTLVLTKSNISERDQINDYFFLQRI